MKHKKNAQLAIQNTVRVKRRSKFVKRGTIKTDLKAGISTNIFSHLSHNLRIILRHRKNCYRNGHSTKAICSEQEASKARYRETVKVTNKESGMKTRWKHQLKKMLTINIMQTSHTVQTTNKNKTMTPLKNFHHFVRMFCQIFIAIMAS